MKRAIPAVFAIVALASVAGCGSGHATVVTPASPPIVDNLFATWEIDSVGGAALNCGDVGATFVDMDIVNVDTGSRIVDTFDCNAYQGTSEPIDVGHFDVLLNLTDAVHTTISSVNIGAENLTTAGTIDLGHYVFTFQ